jgi:ribosomal protein L40E
MHNPDDPTPEELTIAANGEFSAAVTSRPSAPADMNSRSPDDAATEGVKRVFDTQNTSRRQYTPRYSGERPASQPPAGVSQAPSVTEPAAEDGPEVPRDRQSILHLVRMRVLSYEQLARLTYYGAQKTVARRRLRRLHERGWVELWDRPVAFGGTPRYAYPSRRALAWGQAVMDNAFAGSPLEALVRLMTPSTPRQPWKFQPGVIPLFLAHTEEANDVLIAWIRKSGERVLWASSWDCPFPEHIEWRAMPQPDYVLALQRPGWPCLVFGEHDRGTETREVVARKFRVYRTWMDTPDIMERTFGFRSFQLVVTVGGERAERRLRQLVQLAQDEGVAAFTTALLLSRDLVPNLQPLTAATMDFTLCARCHARVPLSAEACSSCGMPTHQLAAQDLTAEVFPPPIAYPAETAVPEVEEPPSAPPRHPPP